MNCHKTLWVTLAAFLTLAGRIEAQMGARRMMPQHPPMVGAFNPAVGAGSQFQMTAREHNVEFTMVIVGKETVGTEEGYWMEQRYEGEGMPGEMVQKQLLVIQDGKPEIKRMIMQPPGRGPMEMPLGMMGPSMHQATAPKDTSPGEKVGTESVTVPAGTFECEHYREQTEQGTYDYWISLKVSPYPIVKVTGPDTTMVLKKLLSGETSHIHGEPQQMPAMPGMPR